MDFPEPIVRAFAALDSKERRNILLLLQEYGGLSYSEICEKMKGRIVKGTLSYHLNKLESAGLISNYVNIKLGKESYYSFYKYTPLCKKLIDSIFKVYEGKSLSYNEYPSSTASHIVEIPLSTTYYGPEQSLNVYEISSNQIGGLKLLA